MIHPAYLWIGHEQELRAKALEFVKQVICKQKGCNKCADCINITNNCHYAVRTLQPEHYYTIAQFDDVFHTLSFALQPDEHFFFIIEHAHLFNTASANSLLKSLEEPPAGYHFILLASYEEGILPTIRSRCMVERLSTNSFKNEMPLFKYFTEKSDRAVEFAKELEKIKPLERDVIELVDQLTLYWHRQLTQAYQTQNQSLINQSQMITDVLSEARRYPPMSGSAKLFLKNLYLRLLTV